MGEYVVSRHDIRSQMMSVRPECRDQKEDCHSGKQESTGSEVIIPVTKEEIYHHNRYVGKPEQIWNDEYLTEGDIVIECHVNHTIVAGDGALQMSKPRQIDDSVDDQRKRVSVLLYKLNKQAMPLQYSRL